MPATDYQSSSSFSFSRQIARRDQVHSVDRNEPATSAELESFQRQVATLFQSLDSVPAETLLSLSWLRDLLDAFLCCHEEFRMILFNNKKSINKPPIEKIIFDYFERSIKALDICNAIRDGIGQIKQWQNQLEIVKSALNSEENKNFNEGQFRRAKKALIDLAISMLDEKDSKTSIAHRNRSFGRNNVQKDKNLGHFRSLSWSVSPNWSASKQIQAIGNLSIPKNNDGLAIAVFTMSWVLYLVMWVLVAAIPCQDRGLHTNFYIPKHFVWAGAILSLHDRILEESRKRERRSACGLMREIHRVEICARVMNELADSMQFPVSEEREGEVRERVREVGEVLEAVKDGLGPLESGVREAFRVIVRSRTEGLDSLNDKNMV